MFIILVFCVFIIAHVGDPKWILIKFLSFFKEICNEILVLAEFKINCPRAKSHGRGKYSSSSWPSKANLLKECYWK